MTDDAAPNAVHETGGTRKPPDFEASLNALIATFAVLVGVSITDFLDPTKTHVSEKLRWWVFAILISLLLRFIMGSAIHLKYFYGNTTQGANKSGPPRSRAVFLFFKDGAFLVLFGVLGVGMSHSWEAADLARPFGEHPFIVHAEWFLLAALFWSIADCAARWLYGQCGHAEEWRLDRAPWLIWGAVDLSQYAVTWIVAACASSPLQAVQILAVIYAIYLFGDFRYSVRSLRD